MLAGIHYNGVALSKCGRPHHFRLKGRKNLGGSEAMVASSPSDHIDLAIKGSLYESFLTSQNNDRMNPLAHPPTYENLWKCVHSISVDWTFSTRSSCSRWVSASVVLGMRRMEMKPRAITFRNKTRRGKHLRNTYIFIVKNKQTKNKPCLWALAE